MGDKPHRYIVTLYALDAPLTLPTQEAQPATMADVTRAMSGHVLAQSQLVGLYERKPVNQ